MISEITGFDIDDDHILILSGDQDIFIYNHDGKQMSATNRHGGGPNEYISAFDAKLKGDRVWVLCRSSKKMLVYDLEGHGLKSFDLPDRYSEFSFLDQDRVLFYANNCSNDPYDFVVYNFSTEQVEDKYFPFDVNSDDHASGDFHPFICRHGDRRLFVDILDYNIYEIGDDNELKSTRRYELNTPFQRSEHNGETLNELLKSCAEGVRYLGCAYYDGPISYQSYSLALNHFRKDYVFRYDESTRKGDLIECVISEDFPFLALPPLDFYKGWYITALQEQNIEFVENKFGRKFIDVDIDSNPVLFFHHFK